jgi:deoxyribodipyrimidine photolyase-related protein
MNARCRHLVLVLGDQLDAESAAFDGFDPAQDSVWMAEVDGESNHVWSTQPRIAVFLAAMRHFRAALEERGWPVHYTPLEDRANTHSLAGELARAVRALRPARAIVVEPGEWRVRRELAQTAAALDLPLEVRTDRHFFSTVDDFRRHAAGRKQLRLEFFYREMRQRHQVLLDPDGGPAGGAWNFDHANRGSFGREGPPRPLPAPRAFPPDAITRAVLALVRRRFADRPGDLDAFDWPVTAAAAAAALDDFVAHRLADFGRWQDAMWTGEPWLFHSRLSAAMNLKLLSPRRVVAAAEAAWRAGSAPLAAVEGFVRQVLGWREYVRGIYWLHMPGFLERNALGADRPLPRFYWNGDVPMACLRDVLGQTLRLGYAHHIQRLMVTGLYALLLGVNPRQVHEWYLAVYVDAVEWVELPNTLGMSQYADGGTMASTPYAATGKYIDRMSNYCRGCAFDPARPTGPRACPFTTLYWDFLLRHQSTLAANQRMALQLKNLARLSATQRREVQSQAAALRDADGVPAPPDGAV